MLLSAEINTSFRLHALLTPIVGEVLRKASVNMSVTEKDLLHSFYRMVSIQGGTTETSWSMRCEKTGIQKVQVKPRDKADPLAEEERRMLNYYAP